MKTPTYITIHYRTRRGASMTKSFTTQASFQAEIMRLYARRVEANAYLGDDKVGEVTRMDGLDKGKWMWWYDSEALIEIHA